MDQATKTAAINLALSSFLEAKRLIERTFAVSSAAAIVAGVHGGEIPRHGRCEDGAEYFVHGVGYTVVFPNGSQAHIDSNGENDSFTIYDVRLFLQDMELEEEPSLVEIMAVCRSLARSGTIRQISDIAFEIVAEN